MPSVPDRPDPPGTRPPCAKSAWRAGGFEFLSHGEPISSSIMPPPAFIGSHPARVKNSLLPLAVSFLQADSGPCQLNPSFVRVARNSGVSAAGLTSLADIIVE